MGNFKPVFKQDRKGKNVWDVNISWTMTNADLYWEGCLGKETDEEMGLIQYDAYGLGVVIFNPDIVMCERGIFSLKISDFGSRIKAVNAMKRFVKSYIAQNENVFHKLLELRQSERNFDATVAELSFECASFPYITYHEDAHHLLSIALDKESQREAFVAQPKAKQKESQPCKLTQALRSADVGLETCGDGSASEASKEDLVWTMRDVQKQVTWKKVSAYAAQAIETGLCSERPEQSLLELCLVGWLENQQKVHSRLCNLGVEGCVVVSMREQI